MTTRVIFCDVDGVFTNVRTGYLDFDIVAVNFIINVASVWNAKLVISSTWRYRYPKQMWDNIFNNLIHDDFKTDATKMRGMRGHDIQRWLQNHPEIEDYLILDDDSDMLSNQMDHFIKCDSYNGLLSDQMIQIFKYLKKYDIPEFKQGFDDFVILDDFPYIHQDMFNKFRRLNYRD